MVGRFFMNVFIDASNIKGGGGKTNLIGLLAHSGLDDGITYTVLCGTTLAKALVPLEHVQVVAVPELDGNIIKNMLWHIRNARHLPSQYDIDLTYFPGTSRLFRTRPYVTVSQNMIPYMPEESARFGWGIQRLKFFLLGKAHSKSLRHADGAVFLNDFALETIGGTLGPAKGLRAVIPNGTDASFSCQPRPGRPLAEFSTEHPFRLLYVSTVNWYKHQWNVVEAVCSMARSGTPVHLHLIGRGPKGPVVKLEEALHTHDPEGRHVTNHGFVPHAEISEHYEKADGFIFASTCENMPIILIEAMNNGLPILCSDKEPMRGILGDAGWYFDPLNVPDIIEQTTRFLDDAERRRTAAEGALAQVKTLLSWPECAEKNAAFFKEVLARHTH